MFSKKIVIISLSVFLLAGAVFLGILSWQTIIQKQKPQVSVEKTPDHLTVPKNTTTIEVPSALTNPATSTVAVATTTTSNPVAPVSKDSGVVWLAEPVKLENLKLVKEGSNDFGDVEMYYKVAVLDDGGEIINAYVPGMGGSSIIRFKKTAQDQYFLIKQNSDFSDDLGLVSKVEIDLKTNINSLNAPGKLSLNNIEFIKKEWFNKTPLDWDKLEKIKTTAFGDFYKELTVEDYNLLSVKYTLKLPDSTAVYYDMLYNFLAGDNSLIASFNNENQEFKAKKFSATIRRGCSELTTIILKDNLDNRLYLIGATNSGSQLYAPKNADDELFKAVYDVYKIGRNEAIGFDGKPVLTYAEFVAKKPVVVWQDLLGDYHIFSDNDYAPLAECGKPVIYLYPEIKTEVKVQIGANVRISEPDYGNGWDVTANPDGKIINSDGAAYENLYWEGLGRGVYPKITEGRIVKQVNIETELRRDLSALGLNQKESADFMEFWLDKMPKTPYIRLTWLDTAEMNELAPLSISPRPDTVKRVFLDFSGQNTSETNLAPQRLSGFDRIGFTVVEWGGLLLGGK